uniref:Cytochrome c domain-containing protein n=1 Tax=Aegilops tauschii subsp. strangulata TaxID=200361 RepID=A0A453Q0Y0_AEGTS
MQSDCAACHSALPYAGLRGAAVPGQDAVARTAEILVAAAATEEALPATGMTPPQYTPDLATVATRVSTRYVKRYTQDTAIVFDTVFLLLEKIQGGVKRYAQAQLCV